MHALPQSTTSGSSAVRSGVAVRRRLPRWLRLALRVALLLLAAVHLVLLLAVCVGSLVYRTRAPHRTAFMICRSITDGPQSPPQFVPLAEMPALLVRGALYLEDYHFFEHHGVRLESIRYAIRLNRRLGYRAYGGSTITQQLARTLYLLPHRSYARKYLELIAAVQMELLMGKERILELYLNLVEWGPGVWGAQSGALWHFGRTLGELSPGEICSLLTILPSPRTATPENIGDSEVLTLRHQAVSRYLQGLLEGPPLLRSELRRVR